MKIKIMDETIESIVKFAQSAVKYYGDDDQYTIYEEAARRLQAEGRAALMQEYSLVGSDDE